MRIKLMKVSELHIDPANVRSHDTKNLDAIAASLTRFGQQKPIVVSPAGIVLAGNGTLSAAKRLGWSSIRVVKTSLENAEATAYGIADNRTGELAGWDDDALAAQLSALQIEDETLLEAMGFTDEELTALVDNSVGLEPEPVEEVAPIEPPENPITQPGDLWLLGGHRLVCGDCRKAEDVDRLMAGGEINVAFTSPPYASQRKYDESSGFKPIPPGEYVEWFEDVQSNVRRHLAGDGSWFVNIKEHCDDGQRVLYVKDLTLAHVREWGWMFVDEFCWTRKGVPGGWPNRFKNAWEPIFHYSREAAIKFNPEDVGKESGAVFSYDPMRQEAKNSRFISGTAKDRKGARDGIARPGNVLKVSTGETPIASQHGATFPIGLPEFFIKAFSDSGDLIYDPFLGSGTTLIAAHQLDRKCYGMEISPAYCDVIVKRWEDLTGKQATRGTNEN